MTTYTWRELTAALGTVLAVLLVVLTPIGTGRDVHHDHLLDLVFPHFHFSNGLVVQKHAAPPPNGGRTESRSAKALEPRTAD